MDGTQAAEASLLKKKWVSDIWRAEKLFTFATIKHLASASNFSPRRRRYLIVAAFSIAGRANTRSQALATGALRRRKAFFNYYFSRLHQCAVSPAHSVRNCQRNWRKIALWCLAVQRDSNLNLLDKNKLTTVLQNFMFRLVLQYIDVFFCKKIIGWNSNT